MKGLIALLGLTAIASAGTAPIASADTYVTVYYTSAYSAAPSTGTYDQNFALNPVPVITDPSGEGGGVQSPSAYGSYGPAE
jgi:hypothetical protein